MTGSQDLKKIDERKPVINEIESTSSVGRFLLFGVFLIVGVSFLAYFGPNRLGEPLFLAILGIFASIGVFFIFAMVVGIIQLTSAKKADEFSKDLIGAMDTSIVVSDADGRVIYANEAYALLLGAKQREEIASVEAVFSKLPEANEIIYKMANAAKKGIPSIEEVRLKNGLNNEEGAKWFRLRAKGMINPADSKQVTVWQVSDVTNDRQNQENTFQELQDAIHYLDHAPAGFMASEENGALVYINATLADWLGMDLTRFEAGSINMQDIISGDNLALFSTLKTEASSQHTTVLDLDMKKSDGKLLPVRLYHRIPVSTDGAPGATRTLVINRAAASGDSDALRDAEIRFTRFFNSTPVAIAGVNSSGEIVRTNAPFQRMFATIIKAEGSAGGMQYTKMVNDEDATQLKEIFAEALSGNSDINPIDLSINGDEERHVRFYVSHVAQVDERDNADNHDDERVIVYAMETTEQRALEDQFAKGQKMQAVGQLAGGIAHDFNNVLTAIIGFSDLLLTNHKPSDPSFQDIMNIKQNANRAASLVRQLLAFSRRQTLRPQVLHLSDVLFDLNMLLDRLVGDRVKLEVKHGRDLWPIKADVSQLEQVIVNLVVNARDAMDGEGALKIRTLNIDEDTCRNEHNYHELEPAEYVLIEVQDEGTGMSKEVLDKIFEPFFSTKEVGKGTGLGLSTVYGIIKQTGGYIYPDSEVGKGTTFRVFLPRHIQTAEEISELENIASQVKEEPAKDLTGNSVILLVEDEDAVRAFAERALISRGYEVHEAINGVEALEIMEDYGDEIDLIVSDVVMPEMDGPTLLTEVRKEHPDIKFIFVSGYAEEAFAKNLPEAERGRFGFLPKPYSLKQLATTVKEKLEEK
jgi:two-component system cell cycle sensor histidine kinase/response regulator CckA